MGFALTGRGYACFALLACVSTFRIPHAGQIIGPLSSLTAFGRGGIRTPGTLRYFCFQDRRIRPLCHSSTNKYLIRTAVRNASHLQGRAGYPKSHDVIMPSSLLLHQKQTQYTPQDQYRRISTPLDEPSLLHILRAIHSAYKAHTPLLNI